MSQGRVIIGLVGAYFCCGVGWGVILAGAGRWSIAPLGLAIACLVLGYRARRSEDESS